MKVKKEKPLKVTYSRTPPPGWPTEEEWVEIDKKLAKALPSKGLSPDASPVDRAKYEICAQFVIYLREEGVSQRDLAKTLGVTESRVSEIVHYHHGRFTIDRLLELLAIIKPKLKFRVA